MKKLSVMHVGKQREKAGVAADVQVRAGDTPVSQLPASTTQL